MKKKRALILSGGGAKGAFQAGALRYMHEQEMSDLPGETPFFDVVSGVSVGTLNGVLVAAGRLRALDELWQNLSRTDIFRGGMGVQGVFRQFVYRRGALLDTTPLEQLILREAHLSELLAGGTDFLFGAVSLETGLYHSFHVSDFDDEAEFRKAVLASASIPVVCAPVPFVRTRSGAVFENLVDGGVRNVRPLGRVLELLPDEIVVINCNSRQFRPEPGRPARTIRIALRFLTEVTLHEIFRRDVREFQRINQLVAAQPPGTFLRRPDGSAYRVVPAVIIEPGDRTEDSMDFSRDAIDRQLQAGYLAARDAFEAFRATG